MHARDKVPGGSRGTGEALRRIAQVFGVPEDTFVHVAVSGRDPPPTLELALETSLLTEAFARITDPVIRRRCLAYVRDAADGEADPAGQR